MRAWRVWFESVLGLGCGSVSVILAGLWNGIAPKSLCVLQRGRHWTLLPLRHRGSGVLGPVPAALRVALSAR